MLVENTDKEFSSQKTFEFFDVNHNLLKWLEEIIFENHCKIEKKEWKSKYNNYVIYDYEPFCVDGFSINILISSNSYQHINFVRYLYENKINLLDYLERCLF